MCHLCISDRLRLWCHHKQLQRLLRWWHNIDFSVWWWQYSKRWWLFISLHNWKWLELSQQFMHIDIHTCLIALEHKQLPSQSLDCNGGSINSRLEADQSQLHLEVHLSDKFLIFCLSTQQPLQQIYASVGLLRKCLQSVDEYQCQITS